MLKKECERQRKTTAVKQPAEIPLEDATAMIYNVNLSLNQYQMINKNDAKVYKNISNTITMS